MKKYYFTLGYLENPIITQYQQAFLYRLQKIWMESIGGDIPADDFLLYPDIHGLLLASIRPGSPHRDSLIAEIKDQYRYHMENGGPHDIDLSEIIPGTRIALTMRFSNPDIDVYTHPDHQMITR